MATIIRIEKSNDGCLDLAYTDVYLVQAPNTGSLSAPLLAQSILTTALDWFNTAPAYFGKYSAVESRQASF